MFYFQSGEDIYEHSVQQVNQAPTRRYRCGRNQRRAAFQRDPRGKGLSVDMERNPTGATNARTKHEVPTSNNYGASSRGKRCVSRSEVYAVQFRWTPTTTTHEATSRSRFSPASGSGRGSTVAARSDESSNLRVDSWSRQSSSVGKTRGNLATYRRRVDATEGTWRDNCPTSSGRYAISDTRFRRNRGQVARTGVPR